jgi:hypothetical protein
MPAPDRPFMARRKCANVRMADGRRPRLLPLRELEITLGQGVLVNYFP